MDIIRTRYDRPKLLAIEQRLWLLWKIFCFLIGIIWIILLFTGMLPISIDGDGLAKNIQASDLFNNGIKLKSIYHTNQLRENYFVFNTILPNGYDKSFLEKGILVYPNCDNNHKEDADMVRLLLKDAKLKFSKSDFRKIYRFYGKEYKFSNPNDITPDLYWVEMNNTSPFLVVIYLD